MPPTNRLTVISTVLNESASIEELIDSLNSGSRVPDEIVIADGGSSDGTAELLDALVSANSNLVVIHEAGGRSAGRNAAITKAGHDWVATIDGGCVARPDWLEAITSALAEGADWVGGFYEPAGQTALSTAIGLTMVYVLEEAEGHFVPSTRSMAFTKETWVKAGGFPEDLQFGEDSAFADSLMLQGVVPTFVPEAVVEWTPPANLPDHWKAMWSWGRGDGLAGLRSKHYKRLLRTFGAMAVGAAFLGVVDLRLTPMAFFAVAPLIVEQTGPKYRHMTGVSRWMWIPIASFNGLLASLGGFLIGRRERKRKEGR